MHFLLKLILLLGLPSVVLAQDKGVNCFAVNTTLAFGTYDVFDSFPVDSVTTITVNCSRFGGPRKTDIEMALGPSQATGTVNQRGMTGPRSGLLYYNLYRDPAYSAIWGQTQGVDTVVRRIDLDNKTSDSVEFTVYGRLFPAQDVYGGFYSDSVMGTIYY